MSVLAVSDFLHSLFIILVATPFILLWAAAIVDVIRQHYSGWTIVGWMILILVLPILGPLIYFAVHSPTQKEIEGSYLARQDLEREAASRPVGSIRVGP